MDSTAAPLRSVPGAGVLASLAVARRRRNLHSALESISLGLSAAALGAASVVLSLDPESSAALGSQGVGLALCASLSGIAMAATWWVERAKLTDVGLAARVDQRLGAGGAFATAVEARSSGARDPVTLALESRACAIAAPAAVARVLPRPGWVWLAPPALGCALLAMAVESPQLRSLALHGSLSGGEGAPAAPSDAAARARSALEALRGEAPGDTADGAERWRLLETALGDLSRESGSGADPAELASLRRALERERERLLSGPAGGPETGPGPTAGGPGEGQPPPRGALLGSGASEGGDSLLTGTAPDRTMARPQSTTAPAGGERAVPKDPTADDPALPAGSEAGTLAGRWWSERHDPVVQGWQKALAGGL